MSYRRQPANQISQESGNTVRLEGDNPPCSTLAVCQRPATIYSYRGYEATFSTSRADSIDPKRTVLILYKIS
jgi:hypothetical protein